MRRLKCSFLFPVFSFLLLAVLSRDLGAIEQDRIDQGFADPGTGTAKRVFPGTLRVLGHCLDTEGGLSSNGTRLVVNNCNGQASQQWQLTDTGSSLVEIVGRGGKCLVPGIIRPSGNQEVALGDCNGSLDTLWAIQGFVSRYFSLIHQGTDFCLDLLGSNTADGTPMLLFECRNTANQSWDFSPTVPESPTGSLRSLGKCLTGGGGSPEPAEIQTCNGEDRQRWRLVDAGNGRIRILDNIDRCLIPGAFRPSGNQEAATGDCDYSGDDLWSIVSQGPEAISLVHEQTGFCLDVLGASPQDRTPLLLFQCHGQPNQIWNFADAPLPAPFLLPNFRVDLSSGSGPTTLLAVRNDSTSDTLVQVDYHPRFGEAYSERWTLGPREVRSVDLRSIEEIRPTNPSFTAFSGFVGVTALDPSTLQPSAVQDLSTDFFRIDPDNDFASGDLLVDLSTPSRPTGLCNHWITRFFNGGPFDGGTTFTFFLRREPPGDFAVISGRVYDESGRFIQQVDLSLISRTTELTADQLGLETPFGAIEWDIESNIGHVSTTYSALGRYSVRLPGTCKDHI